MSKVFWSSLFIFLFCLLQPGAQDLKRSAITDPAISRRCKELTKARNKKVEHKQKINSLLERNKRLLKLTPLTRITIREKLKRNFTKLTQELRHTLNQIQNREENIIRKGCPGITL